MENKKRVEIKESDLDMKQSPIRRGTDRGSWRGEYNESTYIKREKIGTDRGETRKVSPESPFALFIFLLGLFLLLISLTNNASN